MTWYVPARMRPRRMRDRQRLSKFMLRHDASAGQVVGRAAAQRLSAQRFQLADSQLTLDAYSRPSTSTIGASRA